MRGVILASRAYCQRLGNVAQRQSVRWALIAARAVVCYTFNQDWRSYARAAGTVCGVGCYRAHMKVSEMCYALVHHALGVTCQVSNDPPGLPLEIVRLLTIPPQRGIITTGGSVFTHAPG